MAQQRTYDTNTLAMIEALNRNVDELLWYEYLRDEYRALGGRVRECAATLARLARVYPDCIEYVPVIGDRRMVVNRVRVVKKIEFIL